MRFPCHRILCINCAHRAAIPKVSIQFRATRRKSCGCSHVEAAKGDADCVCLLGSINCVNATQFDFDQSNCAGSIDLYLGPKAPKGKEGNWLLTVLGKGYFAILRLYGSTEAAIDKSWKPGGIKQAK